MTVTGIDTSVAVPLLLRAHPDHAAVAGWAAGRELALSGHAQLETFSVLTRLPPPFRSDAASALDLVTTGLLPAVEFEGTAASAVARIAALGITGGATWDALVALAAVAARVLLASRDSHALATYARVGATVEIVA